MNTYNNYLKQIFFAAITLIMGLISLCVDGIGAFCFLAIVASILSASYGGFKMKPKLFGVLTITSLIGVVIISLMVNPNSLTHDVNVALASSALWLPVMLVGFISRLRFLKVSKA